MDRYEIALKQFEDPPKPEPEKDVFGFDEGPDIKIKSFYPAKGFLGRVGFVFKDPKAIFLMNKVHYVNRTYYLCRKNDCCNIQAPSNRYASCLIIYEADLSNMESARIVPWIFGTKVFQQVLSVSKLSGSLTSHDFFLSFEPRRYPDQWILSALGTGQSDSLWQNSDQKEKVLRRAQPILRSLDSLIGEDKSFSKEEAAEEFKIKINPRTTIRVRKKINPPRNELMDYLDSIK